MEKQEKLGGMLALGIPSFRLEKEVLNAEIDVLKEMGVEFKTGVEVGKDVTLDELKKQGYEAFYIAMDAQGGRKLNVEGEDASGVISGVEFLREVNLGRGRTLFGNVVVVGGGNVARTATRQGADTVKMYCLESREEMPALDEEIEEDTITVPADAVLLSIGQSIEWGSLLEGSKVKLGWGNTAQADSLTYQTREPDVFVGGDCCTGPKFAIHAIAAGEEGAISIHRYVQPGQTLTLGRDRREYHAFDKNNVPVDLKNFDNTPRQRPAHAPEKGLILKEILCT